MKKSLVLFVIFMMFIFAGCGNSDDKSDSGDSGTTTDTDSSDTATDSDTGATPKNFSCAGNSCTTDADCGCDASFCMPEAIRPMPGTGELNAGRCTVLNCDVADNSTCPDTGMETEFYECWPLSMGGEYFPEGTESVCMRNSVPADDTDTGTDDNVDTDSPQDTDDVDTDNTQNDDDPTTSDDETETPDTETPDTEMPDTDESEESSWPACYDNHCDSSDECCEGTKCLPAMAAMSPEIDETNYCVINTCTVGDDSTCPENHRCISAMGSNTYCIKNK